MLTGFLLIALAGCGFVALAFLHQAVDLERWVEIVGESDTASLFPLARIIDESPQFLGKASTIADDWDPTRPSEGGL